MNTSVYTGYIKDHIHEGFYSIQNVSVTNFLNTKTPMMEKLLETVSSIIDDKQKFVTVKNDSGGNSEVFYPEFKNAHQFASLLVTEKAGEFRTNSEGYPLPLIPAEVFLWHIKKDIEYVKSLNLRIQDIFIHELLEFSIQHTIDNYKGLQIYCVLYR